MTIAATFDQRDGSKANLQTVENVSLERSQELVRRLDEKKYTEVLLQQGEATFSIAGGSGRYFVSAFTEDERSFILTNPTRDESQTEKLHAAGQNIELPSNQIVDLAPTLCALREFFSQGPRFNDGQWAES